MKNLLTGIPLILTFILYFIKKKQFEKDHYVELLEYRAQEQHQRNMGIQPDRGFYDSWLFSWVQKVPPTLLIIVGLLPILLTWFYEGRR